MHGQHLRSPLPLLGEAGVLSSLRCMQVHEIEHRQQQKTDMAAAQAEAAAKLERQERVRQARLHKEELAHEQKLLVSARNPGTRSACSVLCMPPRHVELTDDVLTSLHVIASCCCVTVAPCLRTCSPSWSPWRPPGSACMPSQRLTLLRRWSPSGKVRRLPAVNFTSMHCAATHSLDLKLLSFLVDSEANPGGWCCLRGKRHAGGTPASWSCVHCNILITMGGYRAASARAGHARAGPPGRGA